MQISLFQGNRKIVSHAIRQTKRTEIINITSSQAIHIKHWREFPKLESNLPTFLQVSMLLRHDQRKLFFEI